MKYTHSIILLHGFSMNKEDMKYYVTKLNEIIPQESNIKFIIPNAQKLKTSIYKNKLYRSWYDYLTPHCDKEPDINKKHLLQTRYKIHRLIEKEIEYYNDPSKVFLSGMSQGCCVAIDAGITFPETIGGIIGFKGHVISKSYDDFKTQQSIWISHGKKDKTIFWNFAKKTYDLLKKINPDIKILIQENVNHGTHSGIILEMKNLKNWLNSRL